MTIEEAETLAEMSGAAPEGSDRKSQEYGGGASNVTACWEPSWTEVEMRLMENVVSRSNMMAAYERVVSNKGAPGIDGMQVGELKAHLVKEWPRIKEELLDGAYQPQPVRKVEIPKPGGGMRTLGIPTVLDRLIQQALHQELMRLFDPDFSEGSYGFRPGRSAHQAVQAARIHVTEGRRWVVDIDLEKFFDRVGHDILMSRVARKVKDRRVLRLIRRYLSAGVLEGGIVSPRVEGTPQGGPLSPLLSNVLLDELDKELERRGHRFVRYADDCNIYMQSRRSAERVMGSLIRFLEQRLKLKVNRAKSAVGRPWERTFLGYSMTFHKKPRLKVAESSVKRLKANLRQVFRRGRGRSLKRVIEESAPKIRGWIAYFRLAEVKGIFEDLDGWVRRKLRCILWRQWKRSFTRARNLMRRGLSERRAWKSAQNGRGPWWNSGASHMNDAFRKSFFDNLGLVSLVDHLKRFQCAL
ncbi:MAG: group II intron reverse transcriptase/maturase [Proteobacteria bacterium]|nr:group II intron reverse transcriptase/maturase [Pseudomonadota bacterium]